jgi:acetyl esterase/lipase
MKTRARRRAVLALALVLAGAASSAFAQAPKGAKKGKQGSADAAAVRGDMAGPQDLSRIKIPAGVKFLPDLAYRDGNPMWRLDLAMPEAKSDQPRAALVFIHGGGWRGGDKRAGYFLQGALDYAARGYVCVSVNYRLTGEAPFPACVEDVRCAVRWLRAHAKEYNVDPNRIGGYGNSAGAHLVAHLALAPDADPALDGEAPWKGQPTRLQAVCASATPTDFTANVGANAARYTQPGSLFAGPAETLTDRIRLASPVTFARADAPPLLLIHGDTDAVVNPEQSRKLYTALKSAGAKDVALMMIHDVGHGVFLQHASITQPAMEAFFARTLKP